MDTVDRNPDPAFPLVHPRPAQGWTGDGPMPPAKMLLSPMKVAAKRLAGLL